MRRPPRRRAAPPRQAGFMLISVLLAATAFAFLLDRVKVAVFARLQMQ